MIAAQFLTNGLEIASVGDSGLLQLWDRTTGKKIKQITASNSRLWSLDISPEGDYGLTGGLDRRVKLWDLKTGAMIKEFIGHEAAVYCVSFTANRDIVCSGSLDRTLRFWNIHTGREVQCAVHPHEVLGVAPANYRGNGNVHLTAAVDTVYAWEPIN